jgi:4-amino-4-deoxychorismate lyase
MNLVNPSIVYLNDRFVPETEASIPVADRGFLFGDGVFTTIKVVEGYPEYLDLHLEKLKHDCHIRRIATKEVLGEMISELIERNGAKQGTWRLKIIFTVGSLTSNGQFLMSLKPYEGFASPCRLTWYPYPICHPFGQVKSLAFIERLQITHYANDKGFDDALVRDPHGIILETSVANIFWKVGEEIFYPDFALPLYQGITLGVLLERMEEMGLKSVPVKETEIPDEAQLYLCNSLRGVIPVIAVDGKVYRRNESFEKKIEI